MNPTPQSPESPSQESQKPPTQYAYARIAEAKLLCRTSAAAVGPETAPRESISASEFVGRAIADGEAAQSERRQARTRRGFDMVEALRLSCGFHETTRSPEPGISYTTEILVLLGGQAEQIEWLSASLARAGEQIVRLHEKARALKLPPEKIAE